MTAPHAETKLSALALLTSLFDQDHLAHQSILDNTPPLELHRGLVSLLIEVLGEYGAFLGMTPADVVAAMRHDVLVDL